MNAYLLNRSAGTVSQAAFSRAYNDRLVRTLSQADNVDFQFRPTKPHAAHPSAVNCIAIDKFEGRYLLSGGADASVAIWDLENGKDKASDSSKTYEPLASVAKSKSAHKYGITHAAYYPFDSLAFLTSSFDHTVRLWSSETLACSVSFDLNSTVYSIALSPIASHLLVACATQHQAVRLIDLRSGASTHSLPGHSGAVLSVAWHPKHEHELASAAADGSIRLWDVRRSANSLGVLDMHDSTGSTGIDRSGVHKAKPAAGRAHNGAANGLVWSEAGDMLISAGHDERIRVWDAQNGANTMINFGPTIKNNHTSTCLPLLSPQGLTSAGKEVVFFPNPHELLASDLHTGSLISRTRIASRVDEGDQAGTVQSGTLTMRPRTTGLAWRAHSVEMYSSHTDGSIRCWKPREEQDMASEDEDEDEDKSDGENDDARAIGRKRKRQALQDIVESLSKRKVTYT